MVQDFCKNGTVHKNYFLFGRAPMGLYMHAAWFYGEQIWHYEGYKDFLKVFIR